MKTPALPKTLALTSHQQHSFHRKTGQSVSRPVTSKSDGCFLIDPWENYRLGRLCEAIVFKRRISGMNRKAAVKVLYTLVTLLP